MLNKMCVNFKIRKKSVPLIHEKSRLGNTTGAINVQTNIAKHAQLEAILTHTVAILLDNVVKSEPFGLEMKDNKIVKAF